MVRPLAAEAAFRALEAAVDYLKARDQAETQRKYIRARRNVLIHALDNHRDILLAYFAARFAERRDVLSKFYIMLDGAMENRDTEQMHAALSGILGILKENPLEDLGKFREKWNDPDYTVEF